MATLSGSEIPGGAILAVGTGISGKVGEAPIPVMAHTRSKVRAQGSRSHCIKDSSMVP